MSAGTIYLYFPNNEGLHQQTYMETNIVFQPTSQNDAKSLADMRVGIMRESLEAVGRFDPERARARFLNSFDPLATTKILMEDLLVGFFVVKLFPDHILLDHLYVARHLQGSGIGSKVLGHVKSVARNVSLPIKLCALKNSPANAFYKMHGFEITHCDALDNYYEFPN